MKKMIPILLFGFVLDCAAMEAVKNKFVCESADRARSIVAELDSKNDDAEIVLKGPTVDAITKDFTDKPKGFYTQIRIDTTTLGTKCPFEQRWLNFECVLHRYAVAVAENLQGAKEFLHLWTDNPSNSKGTIFDYFDGLQHYIKVVLIHPTTHQQMTYGEDFSPAECRYED